MNSGHPRYSTTTIPIACFPGVPWLVELSVSAKYNNVIIAKVKPVALLPAPQILTMIKSRMVRISPLSF